jgi:hypothetical protein
MPAIQADRLDEVPMDGLAWGDWLPVLAHRTISIISMDRPVLSGNVVVIAEDLRVDQINP